MSKGINFAVRVIRETEYGVLNDFLYEAIFVPEGMEPPERSIIELPELQVYTENFGSRQGDTCFAAENSSGKIVGAAWARIMNDYGHIDDDTPSIAVSLFSEYRRMGLGTELMKNLLTALKAKGYQKASLSVQKANYAVKLYRSLGFTVFHEYPEEYTMIIDLNKV